MKIRIQGNSIRYRLRKPEVAQFKKYGRVSETIQLGSEAHQQLEFMLKESSTNTIAVTYQTNSTTVHVPKQLAEVWTGTEQVGFEAIVEIGNGKALKVLVEKDFKCLDGSDAENEGAYQNPNAHC